MFKPLTAKSLRMVGLLSLALFSFTVTGCATRVLMTSDRYEKPASETQQLRRSDDISASWQPGTITLEQAYLKRQHDNDKAALIL